MSKEDAGPSNSSPLPGMDLARELRRVRIAILGFVCFFAVLGFGSFAYLADDVLTRERARLALLSEIKAGQLAQWLPHRTKTLFNRFVRRFPVLVECSSESGIQTGIPAL